VHCLYLPVLASWVFFLAGCGVCGGSFSGVPLQCLFVFDLFGGDSRVFILPRMWG